ncbi:MAG: M15 family metallopeptidase [Firmicutes bacterium]|nr:M15 family metallopeptidase [Bacillota bacterium]
MKRYKHYRHKNTARRPWSRRLLPLLLTLLLAVTTTGYRYRDNLYAYWEAKEPTVSDPESVPVDAPSTPEVKLPEEVEEVVDEPSLYPPPTGEVIQLADGDYLLALVTKQTSLGNYKPTDLVSIPDEMKLYDSPYQLRQEAYLHLREMWEAARANGVDLFVNSAYRSYTTQERIFTNYAADHGETKANQFSARPGQSEHQLGTTVDLAIPGYALSSRFGSTSSGEWLAENAYLYGFVMSYPEGSTELTGYIYEPWHYRYIGVENAATFQATGLVLCQFLEQQPQQWQQ